MNNKIIKIGLSFSLLAVAFYFALRDINISQISQALQHLNPAFIFAPSAAIVASSLFAALRVRSIARSLGYPLTLRDSIAVLSLGQLGGLLFFQIFGQLMARGSYLTRRNVPFAGTVIITGQERIAAALVSLLLAVVGALYLFRQLSFDLASGGLDLIRIGIGLIFAITVVAVVWREQVEKAASEVTWADTASILRAIAFSAAVQVTMMAAYITMAKALAPTCELMDLAAAAALVMFAASIPISFAGWGVRELSAVGALGAIGISTPTALTVAVTIGVLSIICAGLLAALSVTRIKRDYDAPEPVQAKATRHTALLSAVFPILVSCLVFFQIHVPIQTGAVNFNIADPFALICGVIFLLQIRNSSSFPAWRIGGLTAHILACTLVIVLGLVIGAAEIGWTTWAVVNKFLGWFVLLSYGTAGAMAARLDLDRTMLSFSVAGCCVVIFAIGDMLLGKAGLVNVHSFNGFTQNTNALAFLSLMMLAIGLTMKRYNMIVTTLAIMSIILTGSRAGFGATIIVLFIASVIVPRSWQLVLVSFSTAMLLIHIMSSVGPSIMSSGSSPLDLMTLKRGGETEHWISVRDGLRMFTEHPIFGAGLGVFLERWQGPHPVIIHNSLVWLLAEFGLVGALVFIVPVVRIVAQELRRFRSNDAAGHMLILVIAGFAAMSLFHELIYQRAMWFLLGLALINNPRKQMAIRPSHPS